MKKIFHPAMAFYGALMGFAVLYLVFMFYFEPAHVILGDKYVSTFASNLQARQTQQVTRSLETTGRWWTYDTQMLGGAPVGVSVNTNSRAWQSWTLVMKKAGISSAAAFNTFFWLAHLLLPIVVFISARLFLLDARSSLFAMAVASALWYFDSMFHWSWWGGNTAFAMSTYLGLLSLALFYRLIRDKSVVFGAALCLLLPLAHFVHNYIFFALVIPMGWVYFSNIKKLQLKVHLIFGLAVVLTLALNFYWLALALKFRTYHLGTSMLGMGTLSHILTDLLGLTSDSEVSGPVGMKTSFRFLTLGAAIISLVSWRKTKDDRFTLFAVGLVSMVALAYLGGYVWGVRALEPYRNIMPAALLAVIPAVCFARDFVVSKALKNIQRLSLVLLVILSLCAVPLLAKDVLYFVPELAPKPVDIPAEKPHIAEMIGFGSIGYPRHIEYRHTDAHEDFKRIVKWLAPWSEKQGRVLIESPALADYVAVNSRAHVIGGSLCRNIIHQKSNLFVRYPNKDPSDAVLKRYLKTYAIGWVVVSSNRDPADKDYKERLFDSKLLTMVPADSSHYKVFKVNFKPSYFHKGSGSIKTVDNQIEITQTDPDKELLLKFHWSDGLICSSGCTIERITTKEDPVGFIKVLPGHPIDFVIKNGN